MIPKSPLTDNELVNKYQETGDKAVIGELFTRHTTLVFGVCMKYLKNEEESKDAVMVIFEKLITDLLKHEITYFKTWLYSVTKNYCLMLLRSHSKLTSSFEDLQKNETAFMESGEEMHLSDKERKLAALENGIQILNKEQQTCIQLFFIEGKCYNEIALKTGYSLNAIKSYIQNGKRNLKSYLIARDEE